MTAREQPPSDPHEIRPMGFDDFELTLGDVMRGERATLGKSLLEVQREIKIKAEYLAAIEEADLSAFETPGFIGGYVKSYARYLGMNPDWVYRRFCEESGFSHVAGLDAQVYATKKASASRPTQATPVARREAADAVLSRNPIYSASREPRFSGIPFGALASIAVLGFLTAGLAYGGLQLLDQIQQVRMTPMETPLSTAPETAVAAEGPMRTSAAPTPEALERLYRPQALDRPVLTPRDKPIAMLDPRDQGIFANYAPMPSISLDQPPTIVAEVAEQPVGSVAEAMPEVTVVEAPPPKVVLFAKQPAWVRVRAADGTVLFEKILEPGERYVLPDTEEPPTLRAGNSGSLFFAVNGEAIGPAGPGTSVAKNVVLSAEALSGKYQPADLTQDPELARLASLVVEPEQGPAQE